ncbi:hypothetical protein H4R27_006682, partial [Coemansia aciculifera]
MASETANCIRGISGAIEAGEIQEALSQTRLDEIRRDVRANTSTWAELRQRYPPEKSCFEPLNFTVSSWSAIANGDVTGLGDDLDADETYSQAATMAAYGVDVLSSALNGPTVDKKLTEQAKNLFATLCATLMDTRDRHRDSVTKAVAKKVEAFGRILDGLDSSPQTDDTPGRIETIKRDEQTIDTREVPYRDKVEQQNNKIPLEKEQHFSRPGTSDQRQSYSRGRSRSPDSRRQQQSRDHST